MFRDKFIRIKEIQELMTLDNYKQYAPLIMRLGLSFVFLWFGISQLINPDYFLGYVPDFLTLPNLLVTLNGIGETILGTLLLIGLFTRIVSFLLAIHLITIILSLGYNDIAIRDAGLLLVTIAQFIGGADKWCLDSRRHG